MELSAIDGTGNPISKAPKKQTYFVQTTYGTHATLPPHKQCCVHAYTIHSGALNNKNAGAKTSMFNLFMKQEARFFFLILLAA